MLLPFEVTFPNQKKQILASHSISNNFMNIYSFLILIVDGTSSFNLDVKRIKQRCLERFRHETFYFEIRGWIGPNLKN